VLGGDPAAAEAAWRRSLTIRPDFPDARLNLEKLLGRSDEAMPDLGNEAEQPMP